MSEYLIRSITSQDLDEVVRIHIASFSDRALSQLGKGAVFRYYQSLLEGFPYSNPIFAVTQADIMTGFCFNGIYAGSFSRFVNKHKWYLAGLILLRPWLILNPIVREQSKKAIKNLVNRYKSKWKPKENIISKKSLHQALINSRSWGILSIAVDPAYQRKGIAELLMSSVEIFAKGNEYLSLHLTVNTDNISAIKFYEKIGWQKTPSGTAWEGKMFKKIN